jgi:DnaK suppressor protein
LAHTGTVPAEAVSWKGARGSVAKTTRKKLPSAGKSGARKALAAAVATTTKSRSKAAARAAAPVRSTVATTVKSASKPAAVVADKARQGKATLNHKSNDVRHGGRPDAPPPRPIPEAVPTDGKPRKNEAGLNLRDLEHFRDLLLSKRRELVGDMSQMEREALRSSGNSNLSTLPIHMADMGTDNYEQEFTLGLVEKDRNLLREINSALAKIQNGTYGICEGTGKPISKPRLEAQPWARYSIEHARQLERNTFRRIM